MKLCTIAAPLALLSAAVLLPACTSSERELGAAELPAPVREAVLELYPTGIIEEAEAEEENGRTVYEVGLKDGLQEVELKLDAEGTVLETEVE